MEKMKLKPGDKVKFLFPGYDAKGKNEDWEFEDEVVFERGKLRFKAYSNKSIEFLEEEGLIWNLKKIN